MYPAAIWSYRLAGLAFVLSLSAAGPAATGKSPEPTAKALIERHDKEKSPVWADGDIATFFFRGEAEEVSLFIGGESKKLHRLPESDVWTTTIEKPGLSKGIFSYALLPQKKESSATKHGQPMPLRFQTWRGPEAPPAPAIARPLKGKEQLIQFTSKSLGTTRAVRVYLPPGHDRNRPSAVIYATDGQLDSEVLEPLIEAGKIRPVVVIGTASGGYLGDRDDGSEYDIKKDLRALEYLPGWDETRFAKHEKFFCEEVTAWAEQQFGASKDRKDRAVFGVSNGARFAMEMGLRHPDLFGSVFAFSVAGKRTMRPIPPDKAPRFYLAAGVWEKDFHRITKEWAQELKKQDVPVEFHSRYASHDDAMWREELAAAVLKAFPAK